MPAHIPIIRIFISSPGDVNDERKIALDVVEQFPYRPVFREKVAFRVVAWDKPGADTAMRATLTPQEAINQGLPKPSECDIVIVMLWSRMGTPFKDMDGKEYLSGTHWELLDALNSEQTETLIYRRTEEKLFRADEKGNINQYERVQEFFQSDLFYREDGSILRGVNQYETPEDYRRAFNTHLEELVVKFLGDIENNIITPAESLKPSKVDGQNVVEIQSEAWNPEQSPFPGLRSFGEKDAGIFFGRGRETDALVKQVADNPFVAVVGASGSGKSSLVGAGLMPRLRQRTIQGSHTWDIVSFTPGNHIFKSLADTLMSTIPSLAPQSDLTFADELDTFASSLAKGTDRLRHTLNRILKDAPNWKKIVLFIDQFEELFTLTSQELRDPFIAMMADVLAHRQVQVVVTLRADFYHRAMAYPQLAEYLNAGTFNLVAPRRDALRDMIEYPAQRAGLKIEADLVEAILNDTGDEPGNLALMAYLLDELYHDCKIKGELSLEAYHSLGGVAGAIGERAETVFNKINGDEAEKTHAVQLIFSELVDVDDEGNKTRRRFEYSPDNESELVSTIVEELIDARLLTSSQNLLDVAHEALLREWTRLANWIQQEQDNLRLRRRILTDAKNWEHNDHLPDLLYRGEILGEASSFLVKNPRIDPLVIEFVNEAKVAETERVQLAQKQENRLKQLRRISFLAIIATIVGVIVGILSSIGFTNAINAQATAVVNFHIASTAQVSAEINAQKASDFLKDARQVLSSFQGDLALQQLGEYSYQRALLIGLEAMKFHQDGITSDSAYRALHTVLHQPIYRTLHLDFPKGILDVIWHTDNQQVLIASDENTSSTCPAEIDCSARVEIWNVIRQELVAYLSHDSALQTVIWNQSDNQVLTLSYDENLNQSTIILWDVDTETEVYHLSQDHYIDWLIWQSGNDYFVTSERSQFSCGFGDRPECNFRAVVYEFATGNTTSSIPEDEEIINARLTNDGQFLTITFGNSVNNSSAVYNLSTESQINVYDKLFENSVTWTDANQIIAEKDEAIIAQSLNTEEILYAISSSHTVNIVNERIVVTGDGVCETYESCIESQVYDALSGEELLTISHDFAEYVSLTGIIQGGKYLLTRTSDDFASCLACEAAMYLWSLEGGDLLHTFDYEGEIFKVADLGTLDENQPYNLNHDETMLMTHSINDIQHNILELWDIETGDSILKVDLDRGTIQSVQFDRTNQHMIVQWDEVVEIYDIATNRLQHAISHPSLLDDITILHDEKKVAGYSQTDFTIWEVVDWEPTLPNPIGFDISITDQVYNARRTQLLMWLGNESTMPNAYVWDIETGQLLLTLETGVRVLFASWTPDERQIVVSHPLSESECDVDCVFGVSVFDAMTGEHLKTHEVGEEITNFSWIPDTNHLLYSSIVTDSTLVLDMNNGEIVYISDQYGLRPNQWSGDYSSFAFPSTDDFTYSIISYPSNELIQTLLISASNFGLNWVNNDQTITVLEETSTVLNLVGYDVASGEEVYRIDNAGIYQVSHDTSDILVLSNDTQLHKINGATGEIMWTSSILDEQWTDIIWSPDDTMAIISGFFAGQAQLFDVETGEILVTFPYSEMEWSPDSRWILAYDDNVEPEIWRVYDVDADRVRLSFQASTPPTWSPDSRSLASFDGIWSVDFGDLIRRSEDRRVRELTELELQLFFIQ